MNIVLMREGWLVLHNLALLNIGLLQGELTMVSMWRASPTTWVKLVDSVVQFLIPNHFVCLLQSLLENG